MRDGPARHGACQLAGFAVRGNFGPEPVLSKTKHAVETHWGILADRDYIQDVISMEGVGVPSLSKSGYCADVAVGSLVQGGPDGGTSIAAISTSVCARRNANRSSPVPSGDLGEILRLFRVWVCPAENGRRILVVMAWHSDLGSAFSHEALPCIGGGRTRLKRSTLRGLMPIGLDRRRALDATTKAVQHGHCVSAPGRRSSNRLYIKIPRNATHAKNLRPGTFRNAGSTAWVKVASTERHLGRSQLRGCGGRWRMTGW